MFAALVCSAAVGTSVPAGAAPKVGIDGYVRDAFDAPVVGAVVADGDNRATTDARGYYQLRRPATGSPWLTAKAPGFVAKSERVSPGQTTASFKLPYQVETYLGPVAAINDSRERQLRGFAEAPAHRCMDAIDEYTGNRVEMTRRRNDINSGPYRGIFYPSSRPDGVYNYSTVITDCETHTIEGGRASGTFVVDSTGPEITFQSRRWTNTATPELVFDVVDRLTGVIRVLAYLDTERVDVVFDGRVGRVQTPTLTPGLHTFVVVGIDMIQNTASAALNFRVDLEVPSLVAASPQGTSNTSAPLISARLRDAGSGIEDTAAVLQLADAARSRNLPFTYDAATRTMSYQVPATPTGTGLGEGPLPPGNYTVTLTVPDRAGNVLATSWTFTVAAGPPSP